MTESIEDLIKKGYRNWRPNLILGVPFLLDTIATIIIIILILIMLYLCLHGPVSSMLESIYYSSSSAFTPQFIQKALNILLVVVVVAIIAKILITLVSSFFVAGAIGMAQKAIETGKTSLGDMIEYGRGNFISLFFANITISIIYLSITIVLAIVFLMASGALIFFYINITNVVVVGLALLKIGLATWILYVIILNVVFILLGIILIPVPYAVVISHLGAIDALREGYRFFMNNKLLIFFLWAVISAVDWGLGLVFSVVISPFYLLNFISPLIHLIFLAILFLLYGLFLLLTITPLSTVWWTRLYLDRTIGIKNEPSPPEVQPPSQEPSSSQPEIYI